MPAERLSMRRIRDLLRLTFEIGLSNRQAAASLGLSKGAVSLYLRRARTAGLSWPLAEELTDTVLPERDNPVTATLIGRSLIKLSSDDHKNPAVFRTPRKLGWPFQRMRLLVTAPPVAVRPPSTT